MSIATRPDAPHHPDVCPTAAATSRLDRALAPLANLGGAIRDEIAAALMPMSQELETAVGRVASLELQVRDLEARLATAAAALLGLPPPATRPGVEKEPLCSAKQTGAFAAGRAVIAGEITKGGPNHPERTATAERKGSSTAAMVTASPCYDPDTPSHRRQRPEQQ